MIAAGIDLGGTKIEAQIFDDTWHCVEKKRISTPETYDALLNAMTAQVGWIKSFAPTVPIGISSAGLISQDGSALTVNLPASGKPFASDLEEHSGTDMLFLNDCRCLALSEAIFGAGRDYSTVAAIILGTGVGGGIASDGTLLTDPKSFGGEFGHMPLPAHIVQKYNLPLSPCGCGRMGCIEWYASGPGLSRLALMFSGLHLSTPEIVQRMEHSADLRKAWECWLEIVAEMMAAICFVVDPSVIVIGGGLSKIENLAQTLEQALGRVHLTGFETPHIAIAQGGDASGARGAAYAAWQKKCPK